MRKSYVFAMWFLVLATVRPTPALCEGRETYLTLRCNACHPIASEGVARLRPKLPPPSLDPFEEEAQPQPSGPLDLSGVGDRYSSEWFFGFLRKEAGGSDGKTHPPNFRGSEAELAVLVAYLTTLREVSPQVPKNAE